ncbi:MAG TPA: hypothetical protein VK140_02255 [Ktedonobacteraceae bacterium]|nr:hypothetical protein [Ktedonobacteraceae bacterium]
MTTKHQPAKSVHSRGDGLSSPCPQLLNRPGELLTLVVGLAFANARPTTSVNNSQA